MDRRRLGWGLASVVGLLVTATSAAVLPAPAYAAFPRDFQLVGHRGYPGARVTENTLASFARALRAGADGFELDVRITRDDGFVVMHDRSLTRTTTCDGATVPSHTLAWIRARCRGQAGGERIPSLAAVLRWAADTRLTPVVELKSGGWTAARVRRLAALVRRHGLVRRAVILSFNVRALRRVESLDPALRTQVVARRWRDVRTQSRANRPGNRVDGFNVLAADLTRDRVRRLRSRGYLVLGRATDSRADWRRLRSVGVEGLLTFRVEEFQRWRSQPEGRPRSE